MVKGISRVVWDPRGSNYRPDRKLEGFATNDMGTRPCQKPEWCWFPYRIDRIRPLVYYQPVLAPRNTTVRAES